MPKGVYKRRDRPTAMLPISDPENLLGRAYAVELRSRAQLLRTPLLISRDVRERVAADLDALAAIAEGNPEAFAALGAKASAKAKGK